MDDVASNSATARKQRKVRKAPPPSSPPPEAVEPSAGEAPRRLPRIPLRGDPIVGLFFACLIAGFAIAALAISDDEGLKRFGLIGPFLATAAYPVIGVLNGIATRPAARERFADNCYYLGFIFTQAALILAFVPATFFGETLESRDVLGFFGMALSAALTGLIARTILVQLGSSIPEAEDSVHQEVEEVARQVAERAHEIVAEFQAMANAAGEVTATMNARLDELTGTLARFDDVVRQELASFERGAGAVDEAMAGAKDAVHQHQQSFGEHIQAAATALRDLQSKLSSRSEEALVALKAATSAIQDGSAALGAFNELPPRMDALQAQLGRVEELTGEVDQLSGELANAMRASTAEISEQLSASAGEATGTIVAAAKHSAGDLQSAASQARGALEARASSFEQDLSVTAERLSEALRGFRDELARLSAPRSA